MSGSLPEIYISTVGTLNRPKPKGKQKKPPVLDRVREKGTSASGMQSIRLWVGYQTGSPPTLAGRLVGRHRARPSLDMCSHDNVISRDFLRRLDDHMIAYQKAATIAQQMGCSKPLEVVVVELTRDQFRRLPDIQFTDDYSYKQGRRAHFVVLGDGDLSDRKNSGFSSSLRTSQLWTAVSTIAAI
jgi:hypothetical protein